MRPARTGALRPPDGWPVDHVGVAVADLEEGARPWTLLGLPWEEDEDVEAQGVRVRVLRTGDAMLELLAPTSASSPIARFLDRRGPGIHHVAFRVADVRAELERLHGAGAELVDAQPRPGRAGSLVAFLHPRWSGGVLVELVQPAGRRGAGGG